MAAAFIDAQRSSTGLLNSIERRVLVWLAHRIPAGVNSDHLTAIGIISMFVVGVCFAAANRFPWALFGVPLFLAFNWFGDSLDGTLARVRGHQRPRYGFYVDHILDTFGALFVFGGLAISNHMTPLIAAGFLIAYYILSIEIYLATYCVGTFSDVVLGLGADRAAHPAVDRRADAARQADGDDRRHGNAALRCWRGGGDNRADRHCHHFDRRQHSTALHSRTAAAEFAIHHGDTEAQRSKPTE